MPHRMADLVLLGVVLKDLARVLPLPVALRGLTRTVGAVAGLVEAAVGVVSAAVVLAEAVVAEVAVEVVADSSASVGKADRAVRRNSEITGGVSRPFTD